jgi:hypothetical protein
MLDRALQHGKDENSRVSDEQKSSRPLRAATESFHLKCIQHDHELRNRVDEDVVAVGRELHIHPGRLQFGQAQHQHRDVATQQPKIVVVAAPVTKIVLGFHPCPPLASAAGSFRTHIGTSRTDRSRNSGSRTA